MIRHRPADRMMHHRAFRCHATRRLSGAPTVPSPLTVAGGAAMRKAHMRPGAAPGSSWTGMKDRRRFLNQHPERGVCCAAGFALTRGRLAGLSPR